MEPTASTPFAAMGAMSDAQVLEGVAEGLLALQHGGVVVGS